MLPAAGQAALGIEVRANDAELRNALARITHTPTALATAAERAVSRALGGSCSVPLAAHAHWEAEGTLVLNAALGNAARPSEPMLTAQVRLAAPDTDAAERMGQDAAAQLRAQGGDRYLSESAASTAA